MKMMFQFGDTKSAALKAGSSLLALAAMGLATPAWGAAQVAPSDNDRATGLGASGDTGQAANPADASDEDEIIVTGTRRALETSQNIKRNADTVVDSITATDIGAFPDKSVAEALQRVPGITVNRFAASDDTSHFSADPSGVLIRGLTHVRSEFNGRDMFSANSSRGLSWQDIAPDLLAGVDSYKNQTAELIEGGIAGTVNLRTRLPFDANGQVVQASVNMNYGDISKKLTPEVSALYSNRWESGIGEIGLLGHIAYSEVQTQSQGIVFGRTAVFEGVYGPGMQYIPASVAMRDTAYDRTRRGLSLAGQWEDVSGTLTASAQYNRSSYDEAWRERGLISYFTDLWAFPADFVFRPGGPNAPRIPQVAPGADPFTFDSDGNFETGLLVNQQTDFSWWGASDAEAGQIALNEDGENMLQPCYFWQPCSPDARGPDLNAVTRYNHSERMTQDAAFNLKWQASDRLAFNFDVQYVDSTVDNYDVEVGQYSFANVFFDATGGVPTLTFSDPTNINQSAGGLSNPNNYRYNHVMDHIEDSDGEEWAFRADAAYGFDTDWLDSLKVGLRYADRDQTVRYSAYNWGNIANNWNMGNEQYRYWNIDRHAPSGGFNGYPQGLYEVRDFGGGFFGTNGQFVFFNMDELEDRGVNQLSFTSLGAGQDQWEPICSGGGESASSGRLQESIGCFRPDEINTVSESTKAAYVMLKFGGPNAEVAGLPVSGNIGIRYVETTDRVAGSTVFPTAVVPANFPCTRNIPGEGQPNTGIPYSLGCFIFGNANLPPLEEGVDFEDYPIAGSPDVIAFNNGAFASGSVKTVHHNWLPSLNLRFDLSPTWLLRFAASRAMSRPDIGLLKNYTTIATQFPGADPNDARWVRDGSGRIVGVRPAYQASGYNPSLKPMTADQFDLSLENYFADVGSFTAAVFYKKFHDYIQYGSYFQEFTNNGVTQEIEVRGPQNGEGGEVYGAEVAYQRFFDFLPGALSGLGIQANATYVENKGISNSGLKNQNGSDGGGQQQPGSGGTTLTVDSLEGLSKYAFNLVGMYEKYGLAVRVAYNWRSKYLVTAVDCCTYLPMWQKSAGFLDASVRYALTPNFEISVQGSNLLNTRTILQQQVTSAEDGAVRAPNAWFQNDRRFVFGARAKF